MSPPPAVVPRPQLEPATIDDQIGEVEREIAFRGKVYPDRVEAGVMSQLNADIRMRDLRAVLKTLQAVKDGGEDRA